MTITSRYDGKVSKIHHDIDDVAMVGSPLLEFEVEDEDGILFLFSHFGISFLILEFFLW